MDSTDDKQTSAPATTATTATPVAAAPTPARSFLDAVRAGALVVDGAMGTQLYERGVLYSACFEDLNVSRPDLVSRVHQDYLLAGATCIETNSFGANALRLEKHGLSHRVRELNVASVKVAREAIAAAAVPAQAFVLGAIGPSGYFLGEASAADLKKVRAALYDQARALVESGVDALLVETMRQPNELELAVEAALAAAREAGSDVPVIGSTSLDELGRMADGTTAFAIAEKLKSWGVHVIGVNCSDGPMNVLTATEEMLPAGLPIFAVPNAGLPRRVDDRLVYISTPEYFGVYARRMYKLGVKMVGGCCGTTPEHIKRIAAAAKMTGGVPGNAPANTSITSERTGDETSGARWSDTDRPGSMRPGAGLAAVEFADKSSFAQKIAAKKFVVSVEVNPPVGLDPTKAVEAAKKLKAGGIDVVNIADGARAQARMGNIAMAARFERDAQMETILHVCGRDRNLLGTLAHLLAAHDLGIRNLVVITGDPPKMGDFPDASAVYDLDSIGILKLAKRLNVGIDPSGKPLGGQTRFLLATGAEPAALNYTRELSRLEEKVAAGAELVMTQPVYDADVLAKFLKDVESFKVPVLVGLLPLASYRNAEFLHNEVPGMQVPDSVRERMRKAGTGPLARAEGVAIAREMLASVRDRVAGAYVMPPLERYELALEVVDGFLDT